MADETVSPLELFLSECPAALLVALGEAWRNTHGPLEGHSCPRAGQTANPSDLPYDALWLRLAASVDAVAAAERKTLTETCVRALFRRFRSPEISDLTGQHKRAIVAAVPHLNSPAQTARLQQAYQHWLSRHDYELSLEI